jgi:hypothetical protein
VDLTLVGRTPRSAAKAVHVHVHVHGHDAPGTIV